MTPIFRSSNLMRSLKTCNLYCCNHTVILTCPARRKQHVASHAYRIFLKLIPFRIPLSVPGIPSNSMTYQVFDERRLELLYLPF